MVPFHLGWIWHIRNFYGPTWTRFMSYLCIVMNLAYFALGSLLVLSASVRTSRLAQSLWAGTVSLTHTTDWMVFILYWSLVHQHVVYWQTDHWLHIATSVVGHIINIALPVLDLLLDGMTMLRWYHVVWPLAVWIPYQAFLIYSAVHNVPFPYLFVEQHFRIVDDRGHHVQMRFWESTAFLIGLNLLISISFLLTFLASNPRLFRSRIHQGKARKQRSAAARAADEGVSLSRPSSPSQSQEVGPAETPLGRTLRKRHHIK
ncbi:hypothetical protein HDV03_004664 [Kappamyces sp. JEL0829]|nr:hypothetical protein HDV03_004664 [Kappamyces sp. JEL0829]